jgi:hypothetical protein
MDTWWHELENLNKWLTDNEQFAKLFAGLVSLLTALVGLLTAVVGRATTVVFGGGREGTPATPRLPLKLSLKAILKGWLSIVIWTVLVSLASGLLGILFAIKQQEQRPPLAPPAPAAMADKGSHPEEAPPPEGRRPPQQQLDYQHFINEMKKDLQPPWVQVLLLVLSGCIYARAAYVTAHSVKTTGLMKVINAFIAVGSFELASALVAYQFDPEMLAVMTPPLIAKYQYVCLFLSGLLGGILGAED